MFLIRFCNISLRKKGKRHKIKQMKDVSNFILFFVFKLLSMFIEKNLKLERV